MPYVSRTTKTIETSVRPDNTLQMSSSLVREFAARVGEILPVDEDATTSDAYFLDKNFARGSLFTMSIVEALMGSLYFEDHVGTVVKRLMNSRKNRVELVWVPDALLVRLVRLRSRFRIDSAPAMCLQSSCTMLYFMLDVRKLRVLRASALYPSMGSLCVRLLLLIAPLSDYS